MELKSYNNNKNSAENWAIKHVVFLPASFGLFIYGAVFPVISLCIQWKWDAGVQVALSCRNISSAGGFRQNESMKSVAPLQNIASMQSCFSPLERK